MSEALKQKILDFFHSHEGKKAKFYIKDVIKGLPDEDSKAVKQACQELLNEKKLEYWSSGSTTYLVLPGAAPSEE